MTSNDMRAAAGALRRRRAGWTHPVKQRAAGGMAGKIWRAALLVRGMAHRPPPRRFLPRARPEAPVPAPDAHGPPGAGCDLASLLSVGGERIFIGCTDDGCALFMAEFV